MHSRFAKLATALPLATLALGIAMPASAATFVGGPNIAATPELKSFAFRKNLPKAIPDPLGSNVYNRLAVQNAGPTNGNITVNLGFEGTSDYDSRALGVGLIPPDTMGAVGTTQYVQLINGTFSIYNKSDGSLAAPRITDTQFWQNFGQAGTGGDPRVLFDPVSSRWLAIGFGASGANLNIGVSDTADATGNWKTTVFTGFAPGIADYPTLAIAGNSIVIGTNNFTAAQGGGFTYSGTTVNVLPYADIFSAGGPSAANNQQFITPFTGNVNTSEDRGFAIQGVNTTDQGSSTVGLVAASAFFSSTVTYNIENAGSPGASQTAVSYNVDNGETVYGAAQPGRQPTTNGSARVIDTLDDRISGNAWEVNGRIYFAHTVGEEGTNNAVVRIIVLDKATNAVLSETDLSDPNGKFDFYQPSLAVNSAGQVVVGYNRSGDVTTGVDGRVSVFATSFKTNADGTLTQEGTVLLKQSLVDDYHNGSPEGADPVGRQRWGDYSTVTLDPTNDQSFWVTGQFAREFNNAAGGHPGGSGFGRWSTWISEVRLAAVGAVPEPSTWAMMIFGFGMIGMGMRRQRKLKVTYA